MYRRAIEVLRREASRPQPAEMREDVLAGVEALEGGPRGKALGEELSRLYHPEPVAHVATSKLSSAIGTLRQRGYRDAARVLEQFDRGDLVPRSGSVNYAPLGEELDRLYHPDWRVEYQVEAGGFRVTIERKP